MYSMRHTTRLSVGGATSLLRRTNLRSVDQISSLRRAQQQQIQQHDVMMTRSLVTPSPPPYGGDDYNDDRPDPPLRTLVVGSSGALGSCVARTLSQHNCLVYGVDFHDRKHKDGWKLDAFFAVQSKSGDDDDTDVDVVDFAASLATFVQKNLQGSKLDVMVVAAGGYQPDPPASGNGMIEDAARYAATHRAMQRVNVDPVMATLALAQHCAHPDGALLVALGATSALQPTPGQLAYGTSKAAVHAAIQTMGASTNLASMFPKAVRQAGTKVKQHQPSLDYLTVVGILPTILDTAENRSNMPYQKTWVKPTAIADQILEWIEQPALRPHSGALLKVNSISKDEDDDSVAAFELVR